MVEDESAERGTKAPPTAGDRDGYIVDPFGHGWTIATHVEDVEPEEMGRRMAELQKQASAHSGS
jgi:hypothetical protein